MASQRILRAAAFAPYAWIGAVLLAVATFAFPQTDDFCTFGRLFTHSGGNPFAETWNLYQHWTGRYASSFLVAAVGWLSSVVPFPLQWVYAGSLAAMIAVHVLACVVFGKLVAAPGRVNLPFAAVVAAAGLVLMPSKLEGLFWVTGAAVYFAGVACLLVLMQRLGEDREPSAKPGPPWPEMALIAACVGFNEFIALALGAFLALRILAFARTRAHAWENAALLATYAAAFGFSVLAPGNFARDASIAVPRHDPVLALELAQRSFDLLATALVRPNASLLSLMLLGSLAAGWLAGPERWRKPGHAWRFLPAPLVLLASLPMHLLVYSFLSGEETPGRIINQALLLALSGACLLAAWAGTWLASLRPVRDPRPALAIVLLTGLWFLSSPQVRQLSATARDFGATWRAEQQQRNQALLAAARGGAATVVVPAFSPEGNSPPLLQGADIGSDPAGWVNLCVAGFYRVPSVSLAPPPAAPAP